jgi:hypothetical protein
MAGPPPGGKDPPSGPVWALSESHCPRNRVVANLRSKTIRIKVNRNRKCIEPKADELISGLAAGSVRAVSGLQTAIEDGASENW